MLKVKITSKDIKEGYPSSRVIYAGYCSIDHFITVHHLEASFYNCGYLGWNYDVYEFKGYCIITGYSPLCYGSRIKNSYELENYFQKNIEGYHKPLKEYKKYGYKLAKNIYY